MSQSRNYEWAAMEDDGFGPGRGWCGGGGGHHIQPPFLGLIRFHESMWSCARNITGTVLSSSIQLDWWIGDQFFGGHISEL